MVLEDLGRRAERDAKNHQPASRFRILPEATDDHAAARGHGFKGTGWTADW